MKKIFLILLCLIATAIIAAPPGHYGPYDPGAARSNLSNVDATATPSMTSITLSDKIRAVWADILGDIYASGTVKIATGTAAAPAYSFGSDPDTGMYNYGSDQVGFSVGGSSHAYLWKSGNYNLWTNPTTDGNDDQCLWIGHVDRSRGAGLLLYGNEFPSYDGSFEAYIGTNGVFRIVGNGGAESLRVVASTSNLLIGTVTDDGANKLQVNGSMRLIGGAAPTATEGAIYFNSTDKHFYGYNGTAWVQLDN